MRKYNPFYLDKDIDYTIRDMMRENISRRAINVLLEIWR
jgi:hypothetical protein